MEFSNTAVNLDGAPFGSLYLSGMSIMALLGQQVFGFAAVVL